MSAVPPSRVHLLDDRPPDRGASYVLYWMVANRRIEWSFALDRAVEHARALDVPLLILEALRVDYPHASERLHAFALQGMAEHRARLEGSTVRYLPYVETEPGAGKGLLDALSGEAAVVVSDLYPAFFLPRMVRAAAARTGKRFEAVDSCGLLPLAETAGPFSAAYPFRRFLQKRLPDHLLARPDATPLEERDLPGPAALPGGVEDRWPRASASLLGSTADALASLPIDHGVAPIAKRGGRRTALTLLDRFLSDELTRYAEHRNDPDAEAVSDLSAHLHWGHLSSHETFARIAEVEGWSPARLSERTDGKRAGWWGMSPSAEAFLDQLVTWRELGFVHAYHVPNHDRYETLPDWARATLEDHSEDPRPWLYDEDELREARTHDELWNAAQRQLLRDGVIHGYLRMLWGKKILEWTAHPREALRVMLELNDRYAVDGRDPNSYSGIFWTLGRFDRGWPERPVYGKVRSMSSERTRAKVGVEAYLKRYREGAI